LAVALPVQYNSLAFDQRGEVPDVTTAPRNYELDNREKIEFRTAFVLSPSTGCIKGESL